MMTKATRIVLGVIGCCLVAIGLGTVGLWFWFLIGSHHVFIIGLHLWQMVIAIAIPSMLMTAGVMLARLTFRRRSPGQVTPDRQ
jgi:hypothetical protein